MRLLIKNIKTLAGINPAQVPLRGAELAKLTTIDNAYLIVENNLITGFGGMDALDMEFPSIPEDTYDARGQFVLPCWCDSHTHLVFPRSRESEYVDKLKGLTYAEIAERGGGILNSARALTEMPEEELFHVSLIRLKEVMKLGTGAIEIKSGYGLNTASELKMLRVIKRLKEETGMLIRSTFLGAHTYPAVYRDNHEEYLEIIEKEMLPEIAKEGLADYVDVFCETGFFSPQETIRICRMASEYGLKPKLHVNQLNSIGGIEAGIESGAISLDHLETLSNNEIKLLGDYDGICTLLPTAAFFLRMNYQPARKLINEGAAVALASDYNPGSSPSGNMNLVASLSCIQMKMLPEEAINAGTINGACAMEAEGEVGSITEGKRANLIFTKSIPSLSYLSYSFGSNNIDRVMINGEFIS